MRELNKVELLQIKGGDRWNTTNNPDSPGNTWYDDNFGDLP